MTEQIIIPTVTNIDSHRYLTQGSAGIDLCSISDATIQPRETVLIKTGLRVAIPSGFVGLVCSRSGLAYHSSVFVINAPGIIDSDYRGDVGVLLHNAGEEIFTVSKGDRVAQLVLMKVYEGRFVAVDELDETDRGENGFGSTGITQR